MTDENPKLVKHHEIAPGVHVLIYPYAKDGVLTINWRPHGEEISVKQVYVGDTVGGFWD